MKMTDVNVSHLDQEAHTITIWHEHFVIAQIKIEDGLITTRTGSTAMERAKEWEKAREAKANA